MVADKPRRACPACGFIHFTDPKVGVGALVVEDNKILLVRRAMMPEIGKWSIPAGYLDHGEDPAATVVREVHEETSLVIAIDGLLDIFFNDPQPGEGGASIFILYHGHTLSGEAQAGDDADAVGFFAPGELPELAFDSTKRAVREWLEP